MNDALTRRGDDDRLIDLQRLRNRLGFGWRSLGRHKLVAAATFLAVTMSAVSLYKLMPSRYRARATIQVAANPLVPAMVNPRRYYARELGSSAESALKSTLRYSFLLKMIDEHELVDHWRATRSPLQQVRDGVMEVIRGPRSPEEERAIMLGTLESRLQVQWTSDGTADIAIEWPDPVMAKVLVADAQRRFLEARREQQVEAARGAIGILESGVSAARDDLTGALAGVIRERQRLRNGSKSSTVLGLQAEGLWRRMPDPELIRLRTEILALRSAIGALEGQRRQRLAAMESDIAELRGRYGDAHPTLVEMLGRRDALRFSPQDVEALRDKEQRLVAEFVRHGGKDTDLTELPVNAFPPELEDGDPRLQHAREQFRVATSRYADLLERLQTARLELAAAETGFADGYAVVRAPTVPIRPERASLKKLIAGALASGVLAALFAALFMDLKKGTLLEKWQVEEAVGAPTLTEVEVP
jgi:uncharacterized protein involved in exopolysaccharide biosynthesis